MFATLRRSSFPIALALLVVLAVPIPSANAGLDRGWFDLFQYEDPPQAWIWVPDSTSDGSGVEYLAFTASYDHAGPSHPQIQETITFQSGEGFASLQAFVDHIVATVPYVGSSADLTIHKRVVTTVQP